MDCNSKNSSTRCAGFRYWVLRVQDTANDSTVNTPMQHGIVSFVGAAACTVPQCRIGAALIGLVYALGCRQFKNSARERCGRDDTTDAESKRRRRYRHPLKNLGPQVSLLFPSGSLEGIGPGTLGVVELFGFVLALLSSQKLASQIPATKKFARRQILARPAREQKWFEFDATRSMHADVALFARPGLGRDAIACA